MNKIYDSTLAILKRSVTLVTVKRSFLTIFCLTALLNFSFATNYYNYTGAGFTTTATTLSNWTTDATGATLVSQPSNFTTANNIFTVRSGTTINVTSGNAWTVTGAGSGIVIEGTLALAAQLTVGGDLTLNTGGTFTPGSQTVVLNGTVLQTIGGTAGSINFNNLTINNGAIATNTIPITIANSGLFKIGTGNSAGPTYTMGADITMGNSTTATTVGMCTLNCGAYTLSGGTSSTFTMTNVSGGNYSTLASGSPYGITASTTGATGGSIQTATRTYSTSGAYTYNAATGNQVTGDGLPSTILALTINTATATQVVSLTTSGTLISFQNPGGNLNLTSGIFKIGTGKTLRFGNGSCVITGTANGNLANALDGAGDANTDGGTINMSTNNLLTVTSPAGTAGNPTLRAYSFTFSSTASFKITNANSVLINGTFSIPSNNFGWTGNSAMYGPTSTLSFNCGNQAFVGGTLTSSAASWLSGTTKIIASAAGFPNNVTIFNSNNNASTLAAGDWSINGILTLLNSGGVTKLDLSSNNADFNCGGIVIGSGNTLTAPTAHDINIHDSASNSDTANNGNWVRTGTFTSSNTLRAVNFTGGNGATCANPQLISVSSGTETQINNLKISGGTFTKLTSPLTLPATGVLTLTSGVLTTGTNVLSITNTAAAAIAGGSSTAYINGPVTRSLPAGLTATTTYAFPVGDNVSCTNAAGYLPFVIKPQTTGATTATVTAFNSFSGGTTSIVGDTLSKTEYWSLSTSAALGSSSTIDSLQRFSSVIPAGASIVTSGTQGGAYTTISGTATGNNTIKNSAIVGSSATAYYFALSIKNITLPLRLLSFTGKISNQRSILQWQTANEINTDHFEIYKSADGINFTYLTTIPAIKTGNNSYTNVDEQMFIGNNYYRLKTIDNDGRAYFSDIVLIKNTGAINFIIYPNPTTKQLTIEHNNTNKAQINIFNLAGQKVLSSTTKQLYKETIDVSHLQTGTYLIEYINGQEISRKKFVKTGN